MRKINTRQFGEIEVEENKIVRFEHGIPAFEDEHEFVIIPLDEESPYMFLQSANTPHLAFLMTVPFIFFPDYQFQLDDGVIEKMAIKVQEDLEVYVLLTVPGGNVKEITANLLAPVVINKNNLQGRQIVLDRTPYKTKHRLFPDKEGAE